MQWIKHFLYINLGIFTDAFDLSYDIYYQVVITRLSKVITLFKTITSTTAYYIIHRSNFPILQHILTTPTSSIFKHAVTVEQVGKQGAVKHKTYRQSAVAVEKKRTQELLRP